MNVSLDAQEQEVLQAVALFLENECPPTVEEVCRSWLADVVSS